MFFEFGQSAGKPLALVHGGAGPLDGRVELWKRLNVQLASTLDSLWPEIKKGLPALDAVTELVAALESLEDFNAGYGSYLQSDGQARLSASLMDGENEKFSGVHLATHLIHPSRLCRELQKRPYTVLGPLGAQLLARELGMEPESPVTLAQIDRWRRCLEDERCVTEKGGTVGAVVLDTKGRLAAATSTGGDVKNPPERMSDSATVSGNFATAYAAISCTGIGEQITNRAVAARIETRVRDGRSLMDASKKLYDDGVSGKDEYGWIALDAKAGWVVANRREAMAAAVRSAEHASAKIVGGETNS